MASASLSIDETARVLEVSRRTIYTRIKNGFLVTVPARCSQRVLVTSIDRERARQERLQGIAPWPRSTPR